MYCIKKIGEDLTWIGGNNRSQSLFENVYPIPEGVSYNSYFLDDEKTVVFDTVDYAISRRYLENLQFVLDGRKLDYLVVNHMEPDHASVIEIVAEKYPEATIVCNDKTLKMIKQFFSFDVESRVYTVKEGDTLSTGKHNLQFIMAPMVHWPEVMVTYDTTDKILFSADAFGSFGTLDGKIFNDEFDFDRFFLDHARRYYANIVGKYGSQVQSLLKKAAALDIQKICPLHGPVWRSNLGYILYKYNLWSTYQPEEDGVVIAYGSMYGGTENLAEILAARLADEGVTNVVCYDVSKTENSYLIGEVWKYSHFVLASPTHNTNIYTLMENFLTHMEHLNVQNRIAAVMDNGCWVPQAGQKIKKRLAEMKDITVLEPSISVKSVMKDEQWDAMNALVKAIAVSLQ
jgi:flavorubredoxin